MTAYHSFILCACVYLRNEKSHYQINIICINISPWLIIYFESNNVNDTCEIEAMWYICIPEEYLSLTMLFKTQINYKFL